MTIFVLVTTRMTSLFKILNFELVTRLIKSCLFDRLDQSGRHFGQKSMNIRSSIWSCYLYVFAFCHSKLTLSYLCKEFVLFYIYKMSDFLFVTRASEQ